MNWDEDELNRYLNTEQEEIQSESLESLQEQLPQIVDEVKQLRGEKNRKYRIYQSAKSAMNRGELAEVDVQKRKDSYKAAKDDLDEGQVKLDLLNDVLVGYPYVLWTISICLTNCSYLIFLIRPPVPWTVILIMKLFSL